MSQITKTYENEKVTYTFSVHDANEGMRLDQFVKQHLGRQSRQLIKKKIVKNEISISGRKSPHRPSSKVHSGEVVTMLIKRPPLSKEIYLEHWNHELIEIELEPEIVFEDDDLLVISKPAFMATHPTGKHFFNCATVYFQNLYQQTIHSVHRLDRETSGILVLAKDPKTATRMSEIFLNRFVKKCYFLIAHKENKDKSFPFVATERLASPKGDDARLFMETHPEDSAEGKHAKTTFELLWENDDYILSLAFPHTGRQHQIRAHAAVHGFPLLGDKIYNGDIDVFKRYKDQLTTDEDYQKMQIPRHALHALALNFPYPDDEERQTFITPLPKDLQQWMQENLTVELPWLEEKIHEITKNRLR